jgi:Fe-S-cluster containining protein
MSISTFFALIWTLLWGFFGQKIITWFKNKFQKIVNDTIDEINISGEWQSVYKEGNNLFNETITIIQSGRNIIAQINDNDEKYDFKGIFKNNIMTGEYNSSMKKADERGQIALQLVSKDILTGHCVFIYKNKEIYNSPYVWVRKEYHDVTRGTFPFCQSCISKSDCCCSCSTVDMPILLPFEVEIVATKKKINSKEFCEKKTTNIYQMNRKTDGSCFFFINNSCSIYPFRPLDCRLFPFDIQLIKDKYVIGYYTNACSLIPTEIEKIEICANHLRPLVALMYPYLSESMSDIVCEKVSKLDFKPLEQLDNSLIDYKN